jgi:hypothetical protein
MSKMGSHDPFGHQKHKLWPKERSKVKLVVRLPTTKSQESTQFPFVQVAWDISLESSRQGLQLCFKHHLDRRSTHEVMTPQVAVILILGISRLPLGSPGTKCHLDVDLVKRHKVYYMGEGGGFPQVWAMVGLVSPSLPVVHPNTKSAATMH